MPSKNTATSPHIPMRAVRVEYLICSAVIPFPLQSHCIQHSDRPPGGRAPACAHPNTDYHADSSAGTYRVRADECVYVRQRAPKQFCAADRSRSDLLRDIVSDHRGERHFRASGGDHDKQCEHGKARHRLPSDQSRAYGSRPMAGDVPVSSRYGPNGTVPDPLVAPGKPQRRNLGHCSDTCKHRHVARSIDRGRTRRRRSAGGRSGGSWRACGRRRHHPDHAAERLARDDDGRRRDRGRRSGRGRSPDRSRGRGRGHRRKATCSKKTRSSRSPRKRTLAETCRRSGVKSACDPGR